MDESTLTALRHLKELTDARLDLERQGLLTPNQLERKIVLEEQMKYEIANCMRDRQAKINAKKKEDEKLIGQMTYKLKRKLREMDRLREEEDYRQKVEERYEARMKKEKEENDKKKTENEEIVKDDDTKNNENEGKEENKQGNGVCTFPSNVNKKNKKHRQKNKKTANDSSVDSEAGLLKMESLSL